jgi:apolipoprotein N-acyltransferase
MNSRPLPDQGPRLLLWPEAALPDYLEDGYPYRYYYYQPGESAAGARKRLTTLMQDGDVLVTGANRLVIEKGKLVAARNSVSALDSSGTLLGHYDKAHLVPYGEYLPVPWLLRPLGLARLVPGDLDFWPGPGPQTLTVKVGGQPVKVGLQICYEIIFSGQVVDSGKRPDFIFNPSNDAWFGTVGPPQHLAQARLRAIEEGLPIVRATPTGISAIIDADGRIVQHLPLGAAGRIDARLPTAKAPTLFATYGNILPIGFALLLIAGALLPLARRRTSR